MSLIPFTIQDAKKVLFPQFSKEHFSYFFLFFLHTHPTHSVLSLYPPSFSDLPSSSSPTGIWIISLCMLMPPRRRSIFFPLLLLTPHNPACQVGEYTGAESGLLPSPCASIILFGLLPPLLPTPELSGHLGATSLFPAGRLFLSFHPPKFIFL